MDSADCWSNSGNTYVMKVSPSESAGFPNESDKNGSVHVNTAVLTVEQDYRYDNKGKTGIVFNDLCYEVSQKKFCCVKQPSKQILKDVCGIMPPGLNAIMGPTGAGKTSLLDILADRKAKQGISGTILVDGAKQPHNFRFISGYVVQDDIVMGTLTVKENLYFSAALRLPNSMPWSGKRERVESIIKELGLTSCENTKIGNEFLRGVSGGERKRTNIGMELIIEPHVLFLDEPTTGLDAYTAVSVVTLLKQLSQEKNRIIIMSIHQPRYSIYKLIDTLTLLSRGELVFQGPTHLALHHFTNLGYECEEHDNPADFFLDLTNRCEKQLLNTDDVLAIEQGVNLPKAYSRSELGRSIKQKCILLAESMQKSDKIEQFHGCIKPSQYATNFFWQFFVLLVRSILNLVRNPLTSIVQVAFVTLLGIIIGILYFQLDTASNGYQNRIGVVFFLSMMMVFTNMSGVDLFIRQRVFFVHENASGYYRVSAYFLAKIFSDIIPLRLIPMIPFTLITYFMIGFQIEADKFFFFFFTLFLLTLCASATVFWVSAGVGVTALATLLIPLAFVTQMLFGGFLVTRDSIPVWIRWLQYGSVFRYSVEALAVSEVDGLEFTELLTNVTVSGRQLLLLQDFDPDWMFFDWIGLFVILCVFLSLTYITLRLIKKDK